MPAASKVMQSHCLATIVNKRDDHVAIQLERRRCSSCTSGCAFSLLRATGETPVLLSNDHFSVPIVDLPVGERVRISFSSDMLIGLSCVVYLVPVIVMLLFAIGSRLALPESDTVLVIAAATGLASGLLGSKALVRSLEVRARKSLVCDPVAQD